MTKYQFYISVLVFLGLTDFVFCQNNDVEYVQITFYDETRNNRQIKTDVYFPTQIKLKAKETSGREKRKFPAIALGHGFVMPTSAYRYLCTKLASEGYILILPLKERGLSPSHEDLGADLICALKQLEDLGKDSASVFFNSVSPRKAVMGHSMGGGSAVLAACSNPQVSAFIGLAPFVNTKPSALEAAKNVTIPSLIFSGEKDCITPDAEHQIPLYQNLKSSLKTYIGILGGSHCQMAERSGLCRLAEKFCTQKPGISSDEQHQIITGYLILWLNAVLKNDKAAAGNFDNKLKQDSAITCETSMELSAWIHSSFFETSF